MTDRLSSHPAANGRRLRRAAALLAGCATLTGAGIHAAPAQGHHSGAMFDSSVETELHGTIREFRWTNPHSWIEVDVPGSDEPVMWSIEMNPPAMLTRNGWRRSSLETGDAVTLVVNPLRDGQPGGTLVRAVLEDGSVLEARSR